MSYNGGKQRRRSRSQQRGYHGRDNRNQHHGGRGGGNNYGSSAPAPWQLDARQLLQGIQSIQEENSAKHMLSHLAASLPGSSHAHAGLVPHMPVPQFAAPAAPAGMVFAGLPTAGAPMSAEPAMQPSQHGASSFSWMSDVMNYAFSKLGSGGAAPAPPAVTQDAAEKQRDGGTNLKEKQEKLLAEVEFLRNEKIQRELKDMELEVEALRREQATRAPASVGPEPVQPDAMGKLVAEAQRLRQELKKQPAPTGSAAEANASSLADPLAASELEWMKEAVTVNNDIYKEFIADVKPGCRFRLPRALDMTSWKAKEATKWKKDEIAKYLTDQGLKAEALPESVPDLIGLAFRLFCANKKSDGRAPS